MIDTDKYEGHQPAPWRWVKPMGMHEWFLYAERGNHSNLNHQGAGGIWLPDTFCRLGKGLDPTQKHDKSTYDLITDAPKLLAEVKRLRMIVARLEDARIESASVYDRPKLFDAVREIYEQRLQDIYQEKREEE